MLNYRQIVCPESSYYSAGYFTVGTLLINGLEKYHNFLDVGCGTMKVGRLLIPLLDNNKYCGIDPEKELVREGLKNEIIDVYGKDFFTSKNCSFLYNKEFNFSEFDKSFDFVLANQVFIHCGKDQLNQFLSNIKNVTHNNTIYIGTFRIGDTDISQNKICDDTVIIDGKYHYKYASHLSICYSENTLHNIFKSHNFTYTYINVHNRKNCIVAMIKFKKGNLE